jgi:YbbR domain-containing protein
VKTIVTDNFSYKLVALGVAMILWMSMLSKKDSTLSKDFEVQLLLPTNIENVSPVPQLVRVEVAGPRLIIKKLNQMNPVFMVDLTSAKLGRQIVHLTQEGLNLPIGSKILSIEPSEFVVQLKSVKNADEKM